MKYDPLRHHLMAVPKLTAEVTFKFSEIEKIIAARLPKSARTYVEWWANQHHGSQAASWMEAGFVVGRIDIPRSLVTFQRAQRPMRARQGASSSVSAEGAATAKKREIPNDAAMILLRAGFIKVARWCCRDGVLRLEGEPEDKPGVYAFVVNGDVVYFGLASKSLRKRLKHYERPGASQRTNVRLNAKIISENEAGNEVEVLAVVPGRIEWNGLPVHLSAGLELGLIERFRPPWNLTGV